MANSNHCVVLSEAVIVRKNTLEFLLPFSRVSMRLLFGFLPLLVACNGVVNTPPQVTGVNGACGSANGTATSSAPSANLCSVGTPSSVAGAGPWTWSCAGTNGGTTAQCSAGIPARAMVPASFFGLQDGSPSLDAPVPWPLTNERVLAAYYNTQGIVGSAFDWTDTQPNPATWNWVGIEATVARMQSEGVQGVLIGIGSIPYWASQGNSDESAVTNFVPGAYPQVTAPGNKYFGSNGAYQIEFHGGSVPSPLQLDTPYCIQGGSTYSYIGDTFTIQACDGSALNVPGGTMTGVKVEPLNTNPAQWSYLQTFVNALVDKLDALGMPIIAFEGPNEWDNRATNYYEGTTADLVEFQNNLYDIVKAKRPSIEVWCAPLNSLGDQQYSGKQLLSMAPLKFDKYATHAYIFDWNLNTNSYIIQPLMDLQAQLAASGNGSKPIAISEFGAYIILPTDASGNPLPAPLLQLQYYQGKYYAQMELVGASLNLDSLYPYLWGGSGPITGELSMCAAAPYPCIGVQDPNPAGKAWREVRSWLAGATNVSALDSYSNIKQLSFTLANGKSAMASWTADGSQQSVNLPSWAAQCRRIDETGAPCAGTISVDGNPVLATP
jgi:hypothetical protein